ncbi:Lrp/AsnC family transcriptional regulator [Nocardia farcinica]|nr:Lrp/AsnC family transcriptional regulator [Nocardia farcinica]
MPSTRARRLWNSLSASGAVRVVGVAPAHPDSEVTVLRIRVLRGKIDTITHALAKRDDIHFLDVSRAGDEISAVVASPPDRRDRLILDALPSTSAVTAVTAQTVLHVFSDALNWRLHALTPAEEATLTRTTTTPDEEPDDLDRRILDCLQRDARLPARQVASILEIPESSARRRVRRLIEHNLLRTRVIVNPVRLGLRVDANLYLRVTPSDLHGIGEQLARHPAVHGAAATTGETNLQIAVWFRDLTELYQFLTTDIAHPGIQTVETVLVGRAAKRAEYPAVSAIGS